MKQTPSWFCQSNRGKQFLLLPRRLIMRKVNKKTPLTSGFGMRHMDEHYSNQEPKHNRTMDIC